MTEWLRRVVGWLRAGYPRGVPDQDFVPLIALLRRRLTAEEIDELRAQLVADGLVPADRTDLAAGYLRLTDELPTPAELARVAERLRAAGWVVDDDHP